MRHPAAVRRSSTEVSCRGLVPSSHGIIHIQSANVSDPAAINPNFFMLDYDVQQQFGTAWMAREVATSAPSSGSLTSETLSGLELVPEAAADRQWVDWLERVYRFQLPLHGDGDVGVGGNDGWCCGQQRFGLRHLKGSRC